MKLHYRFLTFGALVAFLVSTLALTVPEVRASSTPPVPAQVSLAAPEAAALTCPSLLLNPGFEDDTNSKPDNWLSNGKGSIGVTGAYNEPDGSQVGYTWTSPSGTGTPAQMYQDITATPGALYTMTFYSGTHDPSVGATVAIRFYNSGGTEVGTPAIHTITHDLDTDNALGGPNLLSATAPADAAKLRVVFTDPSASGVAAAAKGDSMCLNISDYGDAPDTASGTSQGNYQTTATDGGPYHVVIPNLRLGTVAPDADNGTLQDANASADNTTNTNDEDGVTTFPVITTSSSSVSLTVNAFNNTGSSSTLACWIDFNRDGDFGDTGERAAATVSNSSSQQNINLTFSGFATPTAGMSYLRCRIAKSSSDVSSSVGGASSGEVEDYPIPISMDLGDAPDTGYGTGTGNYQTTAADGGPSHILTSNLRLGTVATDADNGTLQNTAATSDDTTNNDDETGVGTLPTVTSASTSVPLTVSVYNNSGNTATLACWIDFNLDGDFADTGERASATVNSSSSQQNINLTFSGFAAPTAGTSYLRCRIANTSSQVTNAYGTATTGEVEDYQVTITALDYGDAPDTGSGTGTGNYQTTASDGGPNHVITSNLKLGTATTDADSGTLQNTTATSDDITNTDDEDGVSTLPTVSTSSTSVSLTVSVYNNSGSAATLACWIDFNRDGDFADTGERASAAVNASASQQNVNLTFSGFTTPTAGTSYLRCRIANTESEVASSVGAASTGEVEDYQITISALDFGDAPDTGSGTGTGNYQTTASDGGPNHVITSNLRLGTATTDADNGTLQNTAATSDDTTNTDDEDGVSTLPTITSSSTSVSLTVNVFNNSGSTATVACWIDFNQDGDFADTGERASSTVSSSASQQNINLTFSGFATPTVGTSYLRCRVANTASEVTSSIGAASTGEVEDYQVTITALDYGDAPDTGSGTGTGNYQTTASDGGPSHVITSNLKLGTATTDADNGTLQNVAATSDNTTGTNDEDGVGTLPTITSSSTSVSLSVSVFNNSGSTATVACWIDFNLDGDFADTGERASTTVNSSASQQNVNLTFSGFAAPTAGTSYLRCRVANTASEVTSSVGAASTGEVEDYQVTITALDYGDAPDTGSGTGTGNYQTTASDGGPNHVITANLRLGTATTDADSGTLQNTTATLDNTTGTNDEDGVSTMPVVTPLSTSVSLTVNVFNNSGSTATVACWIDFNLDGDFADTGERASSTVSSSASQQNINLTFSGFAAPTVGTSYLRCRVANTASEVTSSVGAASTGEVEDYQFSIVNLDYGDAPDTGSGTGTGNYNTTQSDNGPSHVLTTNLKLGTATTDADNGTLQNTAATSDNTTGTNDEDGVGTLPTITSSSTSVSLSVSVFNNSGSTATVACWIDFNQDGDFTDTGERTSTTVNSSASQQNVNLTFSGFAAPTVGTSYLRCRVANTAGEVANPTGLATTGEVEDYQVTVTAVDYGDAPDTGSGTGTGNYQTTAADGGPSHVVTTNLRLGTATTDGDSGTLQNGTATADNITGTNDEDGVSSLPNVNIKSTTVSLTVNVFNNSGSDATVACWMDFNRDGDFADAGERASAIVSSSSGQQQIVLVFTGFAAPTAGTSYFRCRIANTASQVTNPTGAATTGEVEDYQFTIFNNTTQAELLSFTAKGSQGKVNLKWATGSEVSVLGFNVWRANAGSSDFAQVNPEAILALSPGMLEGNSYTYRDADVTAGSKYTYKLEILKAGDSSDWSDKVNAKAPGASCSSAPAAPVLVGPENNAKLKRGKIALSWNAVTCATKYHVELREGSADGAVVLDKTVNKTRINTSKLVAGSTYYWRVSSCNQKGKCAAGEWWSFKIKKEKN